LTSSKRPTKVELDAIELKKAQVASKKREIIEGLPHLHGRKWYKWARAFYESQNRMNILTAANQISKSSTQIRKAINWATCHRMWPELWPKEPVPRQFWYLYPNKDISTAEFEEKWEPEFMPRGRFKKDSQYGWDVIYQGSPKKIYKIDFNSGVTLYFKHYSQDVEDLQSGTVHAIFCDEELPVEYFDELMFRLEAVDGHANFVFTATKNQDMWRRAVECKGGEELFPDAFKQQISMYDCIFYEDGTPSKWTPEKIEAAKRRCKSETEIQRRIMGRFVTEEGRKYHAYEPTRHMIKPLPVPNDWKIYSGVDIGSGGAANHPAAMSFIAVRPDYRLGYVFKGWRGDGVVTTSQDVLDKYRSIKGAIPVVQQRYDGASADFGTISVRQSEPFLRAEKSHAVGEDIVNVLFKNDMLFIFDTEELGKLGTELSGVMIATPKNKAKDDFADALRYGVVSIPWDFSHLAGHLSDFEIKAQAERPMTDKERLEREIEERRGAFKEPKPEGWADLVSEFEFWNNFAGTN
jgi:hypothetical protein